MLAHESKYGMGKAPLLIGKRQHILYWTRRLQASRGQHNTMKNDPAGPFFMVR